MPEDGRIYAWAVAGETSVTIDGATDLESLLFIRAGIEKEVIEEGIPVGDQVLQTGDLFTLPDGDIFGEERVTLLYKTDV